MKDTVIHIKYLFILMIVLVSITYLPTPVLAEVKIPLNNPQKFYYSNKHFNPLVTEQEYNAYHSEKSIYSKFSAYDELQKYVAEEHSASRTPNITLFFWKRGFFKSGINSNHTLDFSNGNFHNTNWNYFSVAGDRRHYNNVKYSKLDENAYTINFSNADFSNANMESLNCNICLFDYTNFSNANLTNAYFGGYATPYGQGHYANFSNANLTNAVIRGSFDHADFSNANLTNADLSYGSFRNANFSGAIMEGISYLGTHFQGAKGLPPSIVIQLPELEKRSYIISPPTATPPFIVTKEEYEAYHAYKEYSHGDVSRQEVVHYIGKQKQAGNKPDLTRFLWSRGVFKKHYTDSYSLDLSNINAKGITGRYLSFGSSNIDGIDFSNSDLEFFSCSCSAKQAIFDNANLAHSSFVSGDYAKSSFRNANLKDSQLRSSNFQYADFTGANIDGADFTNSDLTGAIGLPQSLLNKTNSQHESFDKAQKERQIKAIAHLAFFTLAPLILTVLAFYHWFKIRNNSQNSHSLTCYMIGLVLVLFAYYMCFIPFLYSFSSQTVQLSTNKTAWGAWIFGFIIIMIESVIGFIFLGAIWIINHVRVLFFRSPWEPRLLYGYALPILLLHVLAFYAAVLYAPKA